MINNIKLILRDRCNISEELAIFSHNTESWFDDGIND